MKENLLISACLCGENCKYNGGNNKLEKIKDLKSKYNLIMVCPEVLGGLTIPRVPSEILDDKVINKEGLDVTIHFTNGAKKTLEICLANKCDKALLKNSSPSCGVNKVYDGSFSDNKIAGMGITAKVLKQNGIHLYSEDDI